MQAERGLRKHLEECARCRLAARELAHVNAGIPALLPVAVIGWFAAGYSLKAAGIVAAGAAGAAGAGAGAAASGGAGASGASGASGGAASGAGGAGGAAASEGLGALAKAGIATTVAVAAAAGLMWALAHDPEPVPKHEAKPPAEEPVVPLKPTPSPKPKFPAPPGPEQPGPEQSAPPDRPSLKPTPLNPTTNPTTNPATKPKPTPTPSKPNAPVPPTSTPDPTPKPRPKPTPPPPPAPRVYQVNQLEYGVFGDHTRPEVRLGLSSWLWQRWGMSIGGTRYAHGVTVHAASSVTIDLNRQCSAFDAMVGIDNLTLGPAAARFSVYGGGGRLWRSPVMRAGAAAVPAHVPIAGQKTIRLVVDPHTPLDSVALVDWAQSQISCR